MPIPEFLNSNSKLNSEIEYFILDSRDNSNLPPPQPKKSNFSNLCKLGTEDFKIDFAPKVEPSREWYKNNVYLMTNKVEINVKIELS